MVDLGQKKVGDFSTFFYFSGATNSRLFDNVKVPPLMGIKKAILLKMAS